MSTSPTCRFTDSHEWFRVEGGEVVIGITQYAANELTDVTFVEVKPVGTAVGAGESVGEVESVKTTSDVYSAIGGTVVAVNDKVIADPSLVNSDPLGSGWLVRIRAADLAPLDGLMDQATYDGRHPVD